VPGNCTVANGTSQTVPVVAGNSAPAQFDISCTALPGDLKVKTSTSGGSQPSGYTVSLDNGSNRSIGATDSTTYTGLTPTSHTVALLGVPSNCTVANGTSQTKDVPSGSSVTVAFSITCTALPGSITVQTTTGGSSLPTSGYTVTVDGARSLPIGITDNVTFDQVAASSHNVVLSGVPSNCMVTNGDTRTVTVPAGGNAPVAFTISCAPPNQPPSVVAGTAQNVLIGALFTLSGASFSDPDHDGPYTVTIDWGDGSSGGGTMTSEGAINGSHSYVTILPAQYTLTITVQDARGLSGSASKTVSVGTL
jgi:hypothetical protein